MTCIGVTSSRVPGDGNCYGIYSRSPETVVGDVKAQQATVGEKHGGNGFTSRSFQSVARKK